MPTLAEAVKAYNAKLELTQAYYNAHATEVDGKKGWDMTDQEVLDGRKMTEELAELDQQVKECEKNEELAKEIQAKAQASHKAAPGIPAPTGAVRPQDRDALKTLADRIFGSEEYKARIGEKFGLRMDDFDPRAVPMGVKLMQRSDGWAPEQPRGPRVELMPLAPLVLEDLIPATTITDSSVTWMQQTVRTNNTDAVAEGNAPGESVYKLEPVTTIVETCEGWISITKEQMRDVPQARYQVDYLLADDYLHKKQSLILNGTGSTPQPKGIRNWSGLQTQAKGADAPQDAIKRAFAKVSKGGRATASFVLLHPDDWLDISLQTTVTGNYLFGDPGSVIQPRIWGKPVIEIEDLPSGTGLTGAAAWAHVSNQQGMEIAVSDSHNANFISRVFVIRLDGRFSVEVYRPSAFCEVTGL